MITSYRNEETKRLAATGKAVRQWQSFQHQDEKRLRILDAAKSLEDLRAMNSNRLEKLKGDREGQHSIRINDKWRICFEWPKGDPGPSNVEIIDYH